MQCSASETCHLDAADPLVATLDERLAALSGIDPAYGEPLQGQRYAPGQEFKPHTDYFEPHGQDFERYCSVAGQRTWTFMIYLNDVEAGGGTRFRVLGKTVQPERGKLLAWNNRLPDGGVNPATMHHGMKVRAGRKYIVTRWYRERPWASSPTCLPARLPRGLMHSLPAGPSLCLPAPRGPKQGGTGQ